MKAQNYSMISDYSKINFLSKIIWCEKWYSAGGLIWIDEYGWVKREPYTYLVPRVQ